MNQIFTGKRFQMVNKISTDPEQLAETVSDGSELVAEMPNAAPGKVLSPEARRAIEEANLRREQDAKVKLEAEFDGRGGEEPTRYGDWERKGLAVDF